MKKSLLLMLLLFALAALPVCAEDAAEVTVSVPALPQELQNRTVLVSLGSSPADTDAVLVALSGLNGYTETVTLTPADYYCTAAFQYDALGDYPLCETNQTVFLHAEAGGRYELTYALSGAGWYETATGQQRYYTPLPTETPPSGYQAGPAQIGVYLTVPSGFSQPVVAYLQNLYTGDIYELNLYDANDMAAAMPQAVSGKYAYLSARVAGDTAGRYQIESEQAVLLAGDGVDFHLTVTDTEQPNRTMQTPSRGQVSQEQPKPSESVPESDSQSVKEPTRVKKPLPAAAEILPLLAAGGGLFSVRRKRRRQRPQG